MPVVTDEFKRLMTELKTARNSHTAALAEELRTADLGEQEEFQKMMSFARNQKSVKKAKAAQQRSYFQRLKMNHDQEMKDCIKTAKLHVKARAKEYSRKPS